MDELGRGNERRVGWTSGLRPAAAAAAAAAVAVACARDLDKTA